MKQALRALMFFLVPISGETALAAGYDATVMFGRRVELGVPVSGVVKLVNVMTGQSVAAGQTLVALDDVLFIATVAQTEAELVRCNADRTEAVRDHAQARQLYERSVLSNVELENAKLNADRADAQCRQAQSRLTHAKYELEHSKITAPFDGWVLDVRARAGESVTSALEIQPLLVLAESGEYIARMRVPASASATLAIGRRAKVIVAGRRFDARIATAALEPVGRESGDALYEIGVAFNSGDVLLRSGQSARVELP